LTSIDDHPRVGIATAARARARSPLAIGLLVVVAAATAGCLATTATPATSPTASPDPVAAASPSAAPASPVPPSPAVTPSAIPSSPPLGGPPPRCPGTDRTPGAASGPRYTGSSNNWSGYVSAVKKTGVTCVEASWVEPDVTCPKTGHQAVAIWIGIDGFSSKLIGVPETERLIQIGTQANCVDGRKFHTAWREVLPDEPHEVAIAGTVHAGDHISARILYANSRFEMRLYDKETALSFTISVSAPNTPRKTADWIVEAPATNCPGACNPVPLPKFATVKFTNAHATIAGQRSSISDDSWANVRLRMARSGITRAVASTLSGGGAVFSVTWRHS
jgi:hypothetical protein